MSVERRLGRLLQLLTLSVIASISDSMEANNVSTTDLGRMADSNYETCTYFLLDPTNPLFDVTIAAAGLVFATVLSLTVLLVLLVRRCAERPFYLFWTLSVACTILAIVVPLITALHQRRKRDVQLNIRDMTTMMGALPLRPHSQLPPPTDTDIHSREASFTAVLYVGSACFCWLPLLMNSLVRQSQGPSLMASSCTVQFFYLQLTVVPFFLRPVFFLVCAREVRSIWQCCGRSRKRSGETSYWESPFTNSPRMTRSLINDQESVHRRASNSGSGAKRSVCFQNADEGSRGRSVFPDISLPKKSTSKKKNTRYWKRYSCSSYSEPMSLFTSSSTNSINYIHNVAGVPLPNADYKREMIKRRSSAFKGSSTISSTASTHEPTSFSTRPEPAMVVPEDLILKELLLPQQTQARRCSL
ncbi:hypothetical protein BV898_02484 [Hypsibius exemplaris]|uniref:G-protein coupled receptors family 1 profile domain-containing protein n=1 Tax=Hypsibius exemplaris TaxID=2072580 RepID=A0A1W0X8P7_HYPEX|nr:hypothetical protein BV898_02484 [Hypsibius exemplaris]